MSDLERIEDVDRATVDLLARHLPRVSLPATAFDGILAAIQPQATVIPLRPRARHRVVVATAATFAVAAAVVVVAVIAGRSSPGAPDARAAIAGKSDPSVTGEAKLYGSTADGGTIRVRLDDVPPAPSGHHYEVWVLRRNGDGQMESVGSFTPSSRSVELDLPLPGPGDYAAVDISVEEDGGSPAHSDTSLASGAFD